MSGRLNIPFVDRTEIMENFKLNILVISILVLAPTYSLAQQRNGPQCSCDGTEYIISTNVFRAHGCGKLAICAWELKHYMDLVPNHDPSVEGLETKEEYEKLYTTVIKDYYGYPIQEALEPFEKNCTTKLQKCLSLTKLFMESECKRLAGKWDKEKEPYFFDINTLKAVHGKNLEDDVESPQSLEPKFRFKDPSNNAFIGISCPSPLGYKFSMANILFMEVGVGYNSFISFESLGKMLPRHVVKGEWCDIVYFKYDEFYRNWDGSVYCDNPTTRDNYICLNLMETEENRRKRKPFEECGFKDTVHNTEIKENKNPSDKNPREEKRDPVWERKSPDYLAAIA